MNEVSPKVMISRTNDCAVLIAIEEKQIQVSFFMAALIARKLLKESGLPMMIVRIEGCGVKVG